MTSTPSRPTPPVRAEGVSIARAYSVPLQDWDPHSCDVPFVEVPLSTILPGSQLPFHLYAEVNGAPVLYHPAPRRVEAMTLEALWSNDRHVVYIPVTQLECYFNYLDDRTPRLLQEPGLFGEPTQRFYDIASFITRSFVREPDSARARSRAQHLVDATVQRLCRPGQGLLQLARVFRREADLADHSLHTMVYGVALSVAHGGENTRHLLHLGLGLLLHDVSKLEFDDPFLDEERARSEAQRELLRGHPQRSLEILGSAPWVDTVIRDVVGNHHERIDGSGFPAGLGGDELSVDARVAAIADTFDFLTIDLPPHGEAPFRPALPTFQVLSDMLAGGAFDPVLLREFVMLFAPRSDSC